MPRQLEVTADEGPRRALLSRPATPIVGRTIGDFTVMGAVDAGAGVFRAVQRSLGREAIVKVLPAGPSPAPSVVERFLKETQLAARLDHPYAAHIYAFGAEPDGLLWIAMELLRGLPLDVFIAEHGGLAAERFAPFLQRLAEVVDAAHEAGIVHRDIKPGNVMVLSRAGALLPKLLDFGVAALLEESHGDAPSARRPVGSPHYIAPEQWARPGEVAPASDLYSLAVLSYEALTGRRPFDGPSLDAIAAAHAGAPVPLLDAERPGPLDEVLRRALAKEASERYPSAQAFAEALRSAIGPSARQLPRLPDALRDAYLVRAPRPLAEAVADLDAATHPNQALDAIHQLTSLAVRFLALVALAARLGARNRGDEGDEVRLKLRALRRRPLADAEWLELVRGLVLPHRPYREAYPLPELIDLLDADPFAPLFTIQAPAGPPSEGRALELLGRALPLLERLLEAMRFLEQVRLVVGRPAGVEEWTGIRRGRRGQPLELAGALPDGAVALADADGALLVRLDPLLQVARPLPLADEELFLLEGGDDAAARLVAPRDGFTLSDGRPWELIAPLLAAAEDEQGDKPRAPEQSPYLGLASFSASDAALFVGREREVERFLNRLRVQAFVGIVGPSGAGKSSFVGAGVIPALAATWRTVTVRPGPAPLDALTARLQREALCDGQLRAALDENPDALAAELRRHAAGGPILLVVDQFEELFTLCGNAEERTRYADALARAARSSEDLLRVVITLRDDFLVRVEGLPALREKLSQGFQLLSTPEPADLLRILVEPARHVGYDFDDATLPAEMVAQVADQPGALALLSFAALRLWEQRDRYFRRLTRRAYQEMGGVAGALAQHAESVLALMPPAEQRMVRQAFRVLVTAEGTRAVVQRDELVQVLGGGAAADRVVENLVHARLLVGSDADFGSDKLEIIHEALLAAWPRLVEWVGSSRVDLQACKLEYSIVSPK